MIQIPGNSIGNPDLSDRDLSDPDPNDPDPNDPDPNVTAFSRNVLNQSYIIRNSIDDPDLYVRNVSNQNYIRGKASMILT